MLRPASEVQVYLHVAPVDMRKSIDGLSSLVQHAMDLSPMTPALFVFCSKSRDKIKVLYWERNGFVLWYKRLERQCFKWPKAGDKLSLNGQQLNWLLDGFDIFSNQPHARLHFDSVA